MKSLACTTCGHRQFNFPVPHLIECQACGNQYSTEKNLSKEKRSETNRVVSGSQNVMIGYQAGYVLDTGNISLGSSAGTGSYFGRVEQIPIGG